MAVGQTVFDCTFYFLVKLSFHKVRNGRALFLWSVMRIVINLVALNKSRVIKFSFGVKLTMKKVLS